MTLGPSIEYKDGEVAIRMREKSLKELFEAAREQQTLDGQRKLINKLMSDVSCGNVPQKSDMLRLCEIVGNVICIMMKRDEDKELKLLQGGGRDSAGD